MLGWQSLWSGGLRLAPRKTQLLAAAVRKEANNVKKQTPTHGRLALQNVGDSKTRLASGLGFSVDSYLHLGGAGGNVARG